MPWSISLLPTLNFWKSGWTARTLRYLGGYELCDFDM